MASALGAKDPRSDQGDGESAGASGDDAAAGVLGEVLAGVGALVLVRGVELAVGNEVGVGDPEGVAGADRLGPTDRVGVAPGREGGSVDAGAGEGMTATTVGALFGAGRTSR